MDTAERIALFRDIVNCCHNLYLWSYDADCRLLSSNCPQEILIHQMFTMSEQYRIITDYAKLHRKPGILTNDIGLIWVVFPEWEQEMPVRLHILGPLCLDTVPTEFTEKNMSGYHISAAACQEIKHFFHTLPIISMSRVYEYAIMFHFCLYGEKIQVSDLHYRISSLSMAGNYPETEKMKIHGTYEAEQETLRYVRNGDQRYKESIRKLAMTGNIGTLANNDNMRQMKNAVLICVTLFSRAAIEGGLSPETALTLSDRYIQSVEACCSASDLIRINQIMQDDFVQRVHKIRTNSNLSKPIQACVDYLSLHLEEKITLCEVAQMFGYTEYYLSRKFKKETGRSFFDFLREKRLQRACFLLKTTQISVQEIGYRLQFCSQSHFSESFRKAYGISPTQWRERNECSLKQFYEEKSKCDPSKVF